MNELRLILIGIGLLFIAGIYFWDVYKTKQHIRSRVGKISSKKDKHIEKIEITPKAELDQSDLEALSEFKEHINNTRQDGTDFEPLLLKSDKEALPSTQQAQKKTKPQKIIPEKREEKTVASSRDPEGKLIVFYLLAEKDKPYTGLKILAATKAVGMKYGSMDIFHYYKSGQIVSKKALFSLVNIVEPGLFDLKRIENFSTHGLALFMQTYADEDNEQTFDMMLETAWKLVEILGGELQDEQHNVVDPLIVTALREKLYS